MSKSKVEFVLAAFKWLRISGLTVSPEPEEITDGLGVLENMMNELKSRNICSSYQFEDVASHNTISGIDPAYNNAVETNLAVRMAVLFGLQPINGLQAQANQSMSNWAARTGEVKEIINPSRMPRGSGTNFRFSNFRRYYRDDENAPISCNTRKLKYQAINYFPVNFDLYLADGETISSYAVESTNGIEVIEHALVGNTVTLKCKGIRPGWNVVEVVITTSLGRVNPEAVNFDILV